MCVCVCVCVVCVCWLCVFACVHMWMTDEHLGILSCRFSTAHFWACPPSEGVDYIFHCHPTEQKILKPKCLVELSRTMLEKGKDQGVVHDYMVWGVVHGCMVGGVAHAYMVGGVVHGYMVGGVVHDYMVGGVVTATW